MCKPCLQFGIDRSGLRLKLPIMHPDRMSCWHGTGVGGSGGLCGWTFTAVPPQVNPHPHTSTHTHTLKIITYPKCLYTDMVEVVCRSHIHNYRAWEHPHNTVTTTHSALTQLCYLFKFSHQSWWYLRGFGSFPFASLPTFQSTLFLS